MLKIVHASALAAALMLGGCLAASPSEEYVSQPYEPSIMDGWRMTVARECPQGDMTYLFAGYQRYEGSQVVGIAFRVGVREGSFGREHHALTAHLDTSSGDGSVFVYAPEREMWRNITINTGAQNEDVHKKISPLLGDALAHFGGSPTAEEACKLLPG